MAGQDSIDLDYMSDLRAAIVRGPRISTSLLLIAILGFVGVGGWWTSQATLPMVARGEGRVIPSGRIQTVQHFEGGILAEIMVKEGQVVAEGDILLRVGDIQFKARLREDFARYLGLLASRDRLEAEVANRKPRYSKEIMENDPVLAENENALYRARKTEMAQGIAILQRQVEQRQQEEVEVKARITQLVGSLALAEEEASILRPMVAAGVTSRIELIRIERGINDIEGTLETARQSVPRVRSAMREAQQRISEKRAAFRSTALAELNDHKVKLSVLEKSLTSMQDRVQRTDVRSPVAGTVSKVNINTIGGVIRPGMDLVEIVPLEDKLLIEARIRPSDIGFLRPDQTAQVKVTAYDYAVYGSLNAKLVHIGADSITDEKGETYFEVRVRTDKNYLGDENDPKQIIPGMVAQIDIRTGDRSILEYLLKPILRGRDRALRER